MRIVDGALGGVRSTYALNTCRSDPHADVWTDGSLWDPQSTGEDAAKPARYTMAFTFFDIVPMIRVHKKGSV